MSTCSLNARVVIESRTRRRRRFSAASALLSRSRLERTTNSKPIQSSSIPRNNGSPFIFSSAFFSALACVYVQSRLSLFDFFSRFTTRPARAATVAQRAIREMPHAGRTMKFTSSRWVTSADGSLLRCSSSGLRRDEKICSWMCFGRVGSFVSVLINIKC